MDWAIIPVEQNSGDDDDFNGILLFNQETTLDTK